MSPRLLDGGRAGAAHRPLLTAPPRQKTGFTHCPRPRSWLGFTASNTYTYMVDRTSSVQITKQMKGVYFSYIAERSTNIHSIAAAAIEALSACFHQDRACPRCFKWSNTHALVKLA